ncbi:hypothetical protein, partial [Sphaerisporangium dianthi]
MKSTLVTGLLAASALVVPAAVAIAPAGAATKAAPHAAGSPHHESTFTQGARNRPGEHGPDGHWRGGRGGHDFGYGRRGHRWDPPGNRYVFGGRSYALPGCQSIVNGGVYIAPGCAQTRPVYYLGG